MSSYGTLRQAVRGWRHKATRNYPPDCSYKSCFMLGVKSIRKTSPGISFSEISSKSDTTNRSQITEESITYLFHHHSQKNHINAHASINLTKSITSYLRSPFGILEKINKRGTKHSVDCRARDQRALPVKRVDPRVVFLARRNLAVRYSPDFK